MKKKKYDPLYNELEKTANTVELSDLLYEKTVAAFREKAREIKSPSDADTSVFFAGRKAVSFAACCAVLILLCVSVFLLIPQTQREVLPSYALGELEIDDIRYNKLIVPHADIDCSVTVRYSGSTIDYECMVTDAVLENGAEKLRVIIEQGDATVLPLLEGDTFSVIEGTGYIVSYVERKVNNIYITQLHVVYNNGKRVYAELHSDKSERINVYLNVILSMYFD